MNQVNERSTINLTSGINRIITINGEKVTKKSQRTVSRCRKWNKWQER
jgi:hypothetical protein